MAVRENDGLVKKTAIRRVQKKKKEEPREKTREKKTKKDDDVDSIKDLAKDCLLKASKLPNILILIDIVKVCHHFYLVLVVVVVVVFYNTNLLKNHFIDRRCFIFSCCHGCPVSRV
jgi:hypothetical protein